MAHPVVRLVERGRAVEPREVVCSACGAVLGGLEPPDVLARAWLAHRCPERAA
jgi:hypothetical protein